MDKLKSNLDFRLMALTYKFRDLIYPREKVLEEVGIKKGFRVLDFGCGSGSYIPALSMLVGDTGMIYALDINPLAIKITEKVAVRYQIKNLTTILSDGKTGLPSNCLDAVLLYDTFHALKNPEEFLSEIYRILKPGGILSFNDHHLNQIEIILKVTWGNRFKLKSVGKKTYTFLPVISKSKSISSLFGNGLSVL
jgi:ubiquinone/menaquinone biosynthesis C-methylase UbiE